VTTKNQTFLKRLEIAFLGIIAAFKQEANFRIQSVVAVVVIFFTMVLGLDSVEKSVMFLTILVVLSLELINSQIEKFLDIIEPKLHIKVKIIKDFSAGAVLLSALGSIIIGWLILMPHILSIIR